MIILLDNGLRNLGEHSFNLINVVSEEIAARGLQSEIFGYRGMNADVAKQTRAHPHFQDSLYVGYRRGMFELLKFPHRMLQGSTRQDTIYSEKQTARLMNRHFHEDLAALPSSIWDRANIVVFPAMTQYQILGLAAFLTGRDLATLPKIVCQLMMDIRWTPWGSTAAHAESYYRNAFERLRPFSRVLRLTAENPILARSYADTFGVEVGALPIPFGDGGKPRLRNGPTRLGFFGYSKTEKGFHLLPDAIKKCRISGIDANFIVQVQHGGWEVETVRAERALMALDDVYVVNGELDTPRYIEVTNDVDATLLPYDPKRFGMRGSGLFTEAVAAGRPVVAAEGLYAAVKIAKGEAVGETFAPYTGDAFAEAIKRLVCRIDEAKAQASGLAHSFAAQHNRRAYVDAILSL